MFGLEHGFLCGTCLQQWSRRRFLISGGAALATGAFALSSAENPAYADPGLDPKVMDCNGGNIREWTKARAQNPKLLVPAQSSVSREVTEYGRFNSPRGNVEFAWLLFVPQGDEGSEPPGWRRNMQVIYEMGMRFYQRELRGQFNPDLRIIDPIAGKRRFNQYTGIAEIWDEVRMSPLLPPAAPGKFRVVTTCISLKRGSRVGAPLGRNMSFGWGGFASTYALYLNEESRQDVEIGPLVVFHENTHAWFNMPHSSEDPEINGGSPRFREDAKNLMSDSVFYDDTYKRLMDKEIIDPQKRKINVDPATPVPTVYSRRFFLPFAAKSGVPAVR